MKHLLTIISCFAVLSMGAQVEEFPFNPDADSDEQITVEDLMAMLSLFGQPFVMPDYNEWAMGSMYNLLAQEDSLLALENYLDSLETQIANQLEELQLYGDSIQSASANCYMQLTQPNGGHHVPVPNTCRHVNIYTGYGSILTAPLRLPQSGNFVGQVITTFLMPMGNANSSVPIEVFQDDGWDVITTMTPAYFSWGNAASGPGPERNKRFVWDGSSWNEASQSIQILSLTGN